jgi:hypothetical protein
MNLRHRIAQHISRGLKRELGQGIDVARMLGEPLYSRDVLFVCDALRGTELPDLARRYRHAPEESAPRAKHGEGDTRPSLWPSSWFRPTRPPRRW